MNNYDIFIIYQCIHWIGKLVFEKGETTIYNMMNNYDFIHHILCIYFFIFFKLCIYYYFPWQLVIFDYIQRADIHACIVYGIWWDLRIVEHRSLNKNIVGVIVRSLSLSQYVVIIIKCWVSFLFSHDFKVWMYVDNYNT